MTRRSTTPKGGFGDWRDPDYASCTRCRHIGPVAPLEGVKGRGVCTTCLEDFGGTLEWLAERRFKQYKRAAATDKQQRGFSLKVKHFVDLMYTPCAYCNAPMSGVSLDRVDNKKGYTARNIVQCCWLCNRGKGQLSKLEFETMCVAVAKNVARKKRRANARKVQI